MKIVFNIKNINKVKNELESLAKLKSSLHDALVSAALIIEADAKQNCPVDTGILRGSITNNVYDNYAEVGTNLEYAPYVEFGTGLFAAAGDGRKTPWSYQDAEGNWHTTTGQKPQPFLGPALNNNVPIINDLIKDAIDSEVK